MKKKGSCVKLLFILLSISISGCISSRIHPKGYKPNAYPIENEYEVIKDKSGKSIAKGQSSHFNLFWFFPVTDRMSFDVAIDEARNFIEGKPGDNLIEVSYWYERQFWIVGTIEILHIKGKAIRYIDREENE